jgi:antitoxin (DNA-binding transcriptional repressor) of toxin-antitoxin stability system
MSVTVDARELQERLAEYLARAAAGERIVVRGEDGPGVALGPVEAEAAPADEQHPRRRRHASRRTVAEVLAEDRGT